MKIHPGERLVIEAENKIRLAITDATMELTVAETVSVIARVLSDKISGIMKYQIRMERHNNTTTPGGEAPDGSCEHCGADRIG